MAETVANMEYKQHYFKDLSQARWKKAPDWLEQIRRVNEERFSALDFPNRKQEAWRRTNVNPIVRSPFRSVIEPNQGGATVEAVAPFLYGEEGWREFVFVDGFLAPHLSDRSDPTDRSDGPRVGGLAETLCASETPAVDHLDHYVSGNGTSSNAFIALNSAFLLDGAFVYAPDGMRVEQPIHLLFVTTSEAEHCAVHPRNLVVLGERAEVTVVETHVNLRGSANHFTNAVTEVSVGAGAKVRWHKVQGEAPDAYHLATTKVRQERDSSFESWAIAWGGAISRNELSVTLDGEGASCTMHKLSMADGRQLIDNAAAIDHAAPHCSSWIGAKNVLDGGSAGVFSGKVYVRRGAQKTDSNQLNNTLILSEKATIDTKPILEIFADDVKCTHGATVGRPPEEVLFYFRSRGIDEPQARAMLTCGFAEDVIDTIEVGPVHDRLKRMVFERYSQFKNGKRTNGGA